MSEEYSSHTLLVEKFKSDYLLQKFYYRHSDIDIYVNPNSSSVGSISNMKYLGKYEGLTAGYHVIDVSNYNIKLTGQYYTVAVKYTNQFYANIPLEVNYYSFLGSNYSNDMTNKITSNYGESYISTNGYLLLIVEIISLIAAPVDAVITPIRSGNLFIFCLYTSSNKPSVLSFFFNSSNN